MGASRSSVNSATPARITASFDDLLDEFLTHRTPVIVRPASASPARPMAATAKLTYLPWQLSARRSASVFGIAKREAGSMISPPPPMA
jgi:hypothetical protein